jgi:ABC-type Fe3+ transport system, permease component
MLTTISVFFLAGVRYFDRFEKNYASKGVTKVYNVEMKKRMSIPGFIISIIISVFVLLPVLALAYLSFLPEGSLMRDVLIEKFTFENYINMFTQPELFSPFRNSILMSLVSVLMSLFIGISVAVLVARENIPGKRLVEISSTLPYAIPATVVALAFIISFNTPTIFTGFNVLVGTFWILPLAYAVRNIPIVTQSAIAGMKLINPDLESASRSLGAGRLRTMFKVTAPLLLPTIINASLLVFIASVGEFVATIFLYTYETKTVSVEIYSHMRLYNTGTGASYGMLLFFIVMLIVYISRKTIDRSVRV